MRNVALGLNIWRRAEDTSHCDRAMDAGRRGDLTFILYVEDEKARKVATGRWAGILLYAAMAAGWWYRINWRQWFGVEEKHSHSNFRLT